MSRPVRNRLLFGGFWVTCLILGNVLPDLVRLPFVLGILALAGVSYAVSRQFFAGRRHLKKKRWLDAITSFQAFESELLQSAWKRKVSWLAAGIYTLDPIAISRNNIGVVHLENEKLDLAEAAFRSALESDQGYAVPHYNLAVIAAKRGDQPSMESELTHAARLGLTNAKALAKVRAALKPV